MRISRRPAVIGLVVAGLLAASAPGIALAAGSCEEVVQSLNRRLNPKIDEQELVVVLRTLNQTGNRKLPTKFVTKRQARKAGWKPGQDLWATGRLRGKSIGGDLFGNREGRLPDGNRRWREADLDYRGGRRGAKRILFSTDGLREVTVDHYATFTEVPTCR